MFNGLREACGSVKFHFAMADLHHRIAGWFAARGWTPRPHQLAMLQQGLAGHSALLISPTGGGKTLAGFLTTLQELAEPHAHDGIHTLYISPLKALAVDIARNLETPVAEMGLPVTIETRTGDTPASSAAPAPQPPGHSHHHARASLAAGGGPGRCTHAPQPAQRHHRRVACHRHLEARRASVAGADTGAGARPLRPASGCRRRSPTRMHCGPGSPRGHATSGAGHRCRRCATRPRASSNRSSACRGPAIRRAMP
jgi:hypothetical protein